MLNIETNREYFKCGELWHLLEQNILLLRQWGWSTSAENRNSANLSRHLYETGGEGIEDWKEMWSALASNHLRDSINLFGLEIEGDRHTGGGKDRADLDWPLQRDWFEADVCFELLSVCYIKLIQLSLRFGKPIHQLLNHIEELQHEQLLLSQEFCSATCRSASQYRLFRLQVTAYLQRMTSLHFELLTLRAASTSSPANVCVSTCAERK